MMERIIGREYGMRVNLGKTKVMKMSKEPGEVNILIEGRKLEQVTSFRYLGSIITSNGSCTQEIRTRTYNGKAEG